MVNFRKKPGKRTLKFQTLNRHKKKSKKEGECSIIPWGH